MTGRQQPRLIPSLEAMMRGMSEEEIYLLQVALDDFDGTYNSLLDHLAALGAWEDIYRKVNGAIKKEMKKSRADVNVLDYGELILWAEGYAYSLEYITVLHNAPYQAQRAFQQAKADQRSMDQ